MEQKVQVHVECYRVDEKVKWFLWFRRTLVKKRRKYLQIRVTQNLLKRNRSPTPNIRLWVFMTSKNGKFTPSFRRWTTGACGRTISVISHSDNFYIPKKSWAIFFPQRRSLLFFRMEFSIQLPLSGLLNLPQ